VEQNEGDDVCGAHVGHQLPEEHADFGAHDSVRIKRVSRAFALDPRVHLRERFFLEVLDELLDAHLEQRL
jgi:hypothetical protein